MLVAFTPTASAAWVAEDARGDATPSPANEWADLVAGALDGDAARIELARATVLLLATAYVATYDAEGEPTYCAAVQDRTLNFFTGAWEKEALRPGQDVERADGSFTPGAPAVVELSGCREPDAGSPLRFIAIDVKTFPLGMSSTLIDGMDALESSGLDVSSAPDPDPEPQPRPDARDVPLGAALGLAAMVAVALGKRGPA